MRHSLEKLFGLAARYSHVNWALADQAMVSGVNFLTGILFARYLGLEEYGRFTLAWMAVLFCNSFQQAGIIAPMMSLGPKQSAEDEPAYYGAVVVQQVFWSLACFFLLWGGVWLSGFVKPEWNIQDLGLPLAAALLAWQLQDFLRRYFFVRGKGGLAFLNDTVSYLGQLGLLVALFRWTTLDTALVLWLIAGTSALAVGVGLWGMRGLAVPHGLIADVTWRHWRFSKWLIATAMLQYSCGNIFFLVAGAVIGPAAVGGLKAAQNIMGISHVFFQGLENVVPVKASRIFHETGLRPLLKYFEKVALLGGGCVGGLALAAIVAPNFWLNLFYGSQFNDYGDVLRIYALTYLFMFLGFVLRSMLRTLEITRPIFSAYLFTLSVSLLLAYPLARYWGANGAAIGGLFAQMATQTYLVFCLLRFFSFNKIEKTL